MLQIYQNKPDFFYYYGVLESINNEQETVLNRQLPERWFRREMSTSLTQLSPNQIPYIFSCGS
jgi:hypothetical protein